MTIFNYTLNYIDLALALIFALFVFIGYKRGIFMTVISFIRYSVGFSLCFYCSSNLAQPLYDFYVRQKALDAISKKIADETNIDSTLKNLEDFINSLPDFISSSIGFDSLNIPDSDSVAETILDEVFEPILVALCKAGIFVVVFILFFAATGLIIKLIKHSSKKKKGKKASPLKKADKITGALFGVLKSFVIVLAISSILMYILNMNQNNAEPGAFVLQLRQSKLLELIESINPFNALTQDIL